MIIDTSKLLPIEVDAIVGRKYILGRLIHLPHGFYVQEISRLTLEVGGVVGGHHNSAESSWQPFSSGFVFTDRKGGWWYPTSYWSHSYQGMLLGYYNHTHASPHNLCLVPDVSSNKHSLIYLISSCQRFHLTTIPRLREQFIAKNISLDRIKVVVNGSNAAKVEDHEGITHCFTKHAAWELSALFEAPQWDFDYALMLHDTCELGESFGEVAVSINDAFEWDILPASPRFRCAMGFYRKPFLTSIHSYLESLDEMSKHDAVIHEMAPILLMHANAALAFPHCTWTNELSRKFGQSIRSKVDFHSVGIHKYVHRGGPHLAL